MLVSLIFTVVLAILAAYFASNNLNVITVNLLGYPLSQTSGVMIVAAFGIGLLIGVVLMIPAVVSRSWALIRHKRKLQDWQDAVGRKYSSGEEQDK